MLDGRVWQAPSNMPPLRQITDAGRRTRKNLGQGVQRGRGHGAMQHRVAPNQPRCASCRRHHLAVRSQCGWDGNARSSTHRWHRARGDKERKYAELVHSQRCHLIVVGLETGGRWSGETAEFVRQLACCRGRVSSAGRGNGRGCSPFLGTGRSQVHWDPRVRMPDLADLLTKHIVNGFF